MAVFVGLCWQQRCAARRMQRGGQQCSWVGGLRLPTGRSSGGRSVPTQLCTVVNQKPCFVRTKSRLTLHSGRCNHQRASQNDHGCTLACTVAVMTGTCWSQEHSHGRHRTPAKCHRICSAAVMDGLHRRQAAEEGCLCLGPPVAPAPLCKLSCCHLAQCVSGLTPQPQLKNEMITLYPCGLQANTRVQA